MTRLLQSLLLVICAALFLLSIAVRAKFEWSVGGLSVERGHRYFAQTGGGAFSLGVATLSAFPRRDPSAPMDDLNVGGPPQPTPYSDHWLLRAGPDIPTTELTSRGRFQYSWTEGAGNYGDRQDADGFIIPASFVMKASGFALAIWLVTIALRKWRRRRARSAGRCLACGYDLRASNERCPECGTLCGNPGLVAISSRRI